MSDALTAAPERVRLIVFDWDGTLIDSIGTIVGCTRAMLEELGLPAVAEEAIRSMIGSGLEESIRSFAPGYDECDFDRVINTYRRLWVEEYHARSELFAGAGEVVRGLHAAGYLLAVATAKGRRGLGLDLARCGLAGYFHTTRTVDEAPSKPNPGMLLDILEEMGVRAEEALMVGDSVHDLRMGLPAWPRFWTCPPGSARAMIHRMSDTEHQDLVTILETSDVNLLAVVKSVLQGAEIPFLVQGDEALGLLPMANIGGPFSKRGLGVAVMVSAGDETAALELLSEVSEP
jgi:phosphoglycolate phosphatase